MKNETHALAAAAVTAADHTDETDLGSPLANGPEVAVDAAPAAAPKALHRRRLRDVYRSAGWPCCDMIEVELLGMRLLERVRHATGHETLRVTDAGIAVMAETLVRNRASRDAHEALVERVAREMTRAGRLAWRGLSLRAKIDTGWTMAMPDVFSIRNTSVEDYLEPVVHEIKVRRADLLADLKRGSKRAAYLDLGGECWYVIREGIARPNEIPLECGVIVASLADDRLDVARPAPRRGLRLPFHVWMTLARSTPVPGWRSDESQPWLGLATTGTDTDTESESESESEPIAADAPKEPPCR